MENCFDIALTDDQIRNISSIGLAHMGDAVFEILVRGWLCAHGKATGKGMHQATIKLVCAESQATKADRILPVLTEEELDSFVANINDKKCKAIYLGHDVLPTAEQEKIFKKLGITINVIPDYYYRDLEA
jgi:hypothetical protein